MHAKVGRWVVRGSEAQCTYSVVMMGFTSFLLLLLFVLLLLLLLLLLRFLFELPLEAVVAEDDEAA